LQVVTGLAAIASEGMYHPPRIVARVVHADGSLEPLPDRPAVRIISARAAKEMTTIMEGVTQPGGTARAAAIDGYVVAGKTGTAQKVSGGHYDSTKWVSSFIGFVPAEAPRIAIAVMVDEPQGGHLGGAVAAPIFKEIAEQALAYLHVPPSPALLARKPPPAAGKGAAAGREAVANGPPSAVIASDGDEDERPGSDVAEVREADEGDGTIDSNEGGAPNMEADATALRGDDGAERDHGGGDGDPAGGPAPLVTVPSFRGLTIAAAVRAARRSEVDLVFDDRQPATGVALWQSPAPGPAARGVVCKVAFGRPP
jgi:membrane peptidoglycan carboxypeptidase